MSRSVALYVAAGIVALAALPLPYSYYTGVRFVATLAFAYVALECWHAQAWTTLVMSLVLAVVFNPFLPFHSTKEIWATIDLSAAAFLGVITSHVVTRFEGFASPERSLGQIIFFLLAAAVTSVFGMTLLAFVLFVLSLPADLLGYQPPTRTLRYLYPGVGVASAVAFITGWAYRSGDARERK